MTADRIAFDADTEEFALDTVANILFRILYGEDFVVGRGEALARREAIDGRVLQTVRGPVIDDAWRS